MDPLGFFGVLVIGNGQCQVHRQHRFVKALKGFSFKVGLENSLTIAGTYSGEVFLAHAMPLVFHGFSSWLCMAA